MKTHEEQSTGLQESRIEERAKELRCLYSIAEILTRTDLSLDQVLQGVVEMIPQGYQHSHLCRARICWGKERFESPGFRESPWIQSVPLVAEEEEIGSLDVVYLAHGLAKNEATFLREEKKLIEIIGQKVGQYIEARMPNSENMSSHSKTEQPRHPHEEKPEWRNILELLRETDESLYRRILRRLMNHLIMQGVPGVQALVRSFGPAVFATRMRDSHGSNQPLPKGSMASLETLFEEVQRIAFIMIKPEEISCLLKQWMRQDKLGFLTHAVERSNISFLEISEIVDRFCRKTREKDTGLSPSDDLKVRVALARRFLTDSPTFIRSAKEHMTVHDFGRLLSRVMGPPQGSGKLGGKAAGMILATHILKSKGRDNPLLQGLKIPPTWYVTSDGLFDFVHHNSLEDLLSYKFSSLDVVQNDFAYLEQVFKHSFFPQEMAQRLMFALEDLGEVPLIVRSSSLLEDREDSTFSGKYRSLFLANQGNKQQRLAALLDAIAEVYASTFGLDPIQYRAERGLLDFQEEMGIIIQGVVGRRIGKYFFPAFAGVAFSNNEFRWSPRIRREDGVVRLVAGLGTRAVDRVGNDFPALLSPGQPDLRVNVTPEQWLHYSQTTIDVLNLETGQFEAPPIQEVFREVGEAFPMLDKIVSVYEDGTLRRRSLALLDVESANLVVTFAGLIESTDFVKQMREILRILQEVLGTPVDVEFAHDGQSLHILQCRPQSRMGEDEPVTIPHSIPQNHKLFSANKYVTSARVVGIQTIVYVDPEEYSKLPSREEMVQVAEAVGRLNALLPRRSFILMGPGRWGSRGDITLGVGVTYASICNTQMLIEVARKKGSYVPDLSFGTHFFQDLVEAKIRYLALYPDEEGVLFDEQYFKGSHNSLKDLLPDCGNLENVVRVIDVPRVSGGLELHVFMDGEREQALAFLADKRDLKIVS